jgi:hypothetical protein
MNAFQKWNRDRHRDALRLEAKVDALRQAMLKGSGVSKNVGGCMCGDGTGHPCAAHAGAWNALLEAREALDKAARDLAALSRGEGY